METIDRSISSFLEVPKIPKISEILDITLCNSHSAFMRQVISAAAFARIISVDPKTVRNWINKGLIPNVRKVGKRFQIPIDEVEKAKTLPEYPPQDHLTNNQSP